MRMNDKKHVLEACFLRIVLFMTVIMILSGCASVYVPPTPPPPEPEPMPWEQITEATGKSDFVVQNLSIIPIGEHSVKVLGTVTVCWYEIRTYDSRVVKYRKVWLSKDPNNPVAGIGNSAWGGWISEPSYEYRNESKKRVDWMPSKLSISNPYGQNAEADIVPSGEFSAIIRVDEKYFLTYPSSHSNKYYSIYNYKEQGKVTISAPAPPEYSNVHFPSRNGDMKVYFYDIDWKKVEGFVQKFVQNRITAVSIDVRDKITHLPVSPVIQITGVQVPSRNDVLAELRLEFGEESILKKAAELVPSWLEQGEVKKENGQSMTFQAIVGGTYKVETMHGQYYYFSGFLKPLQTPMVAKTVLLVEKGSKTRLENVKEGEGGEIVDAQ